MTGDIRIRVSWDTAYWAAERLLEYAESLVWQRLGFRSHGVVENVQSTERLAQQHAEGALQFLKRVYPAPKKAIRARRTGRRVVCDGR